MSIISSPLVYNHVYHVIEFDELLAGQRAATDVLWVQSHEELSSRSSVSDEEARGAAPVPPELLTQMDALERRFARLRVELGGSGSSSESGMRGELLAWRRHVEQRLGEHLARCPLPAPPLPAPPPPPTTAATPAAAAPDAEDSTGASSAHSSAPPADTIETNASFA